MPSEQDTPYDPCHAFFLFTATDRFENFVACQIIGNEVVVLVLISYVTENYPFLGYD
jgi:hypothetical protein